MKNMKIETEYLGMYGDDGNAGWSATITRVIGKGEGTSADSATAAAVEDAEKASSDWIRITPGCEMPVYCQQFAAYSPGRISHLYVGDGDQWHTVNSGLEVHKEHFTHWMPLLPPREEKR